MASARPSGTPSLILTLTIVERVSDSGIVQRYRSAAVVSATTTGSILAISRYPKIDTPSTSASVRRKEVAVLPDMVLVRWLNG
jgi:hypothetical protein